MTHLAILALLALLCPAGALAQGDVATDPLLGMLGAVDLRLMVALAVLAGVLRQLEQVPAGFAVAFPTAGGILFGALQAIYAAGGANPYEVAVASVVTGAGATIVGRAVAASFEPRTKA